MDLPWSLAKSSFPLDCDSIVSGNQKRSSSTRLGRLTVPHNLSVISVFWKIKHLQRSTMILTAQQICCPHTVKAVRTLGAGQLHSLSIVPSPLHVPTCLPLFLFLALGLLIWNNRTLICHSPHLVPACHSNSNISLQMIQNEVIFSFKMIPTVFLKS